MAERLILVGKVQGAFGVRGELRIWPYTEDAAALLRYRVLRRADGAHALTLTEGRVQGRALIARADEAATREAAEAIRGLELYVARDALPPPEEGEFYLADLIGLEALDPAGARLGRIRSVEDFGAGDLLEIEPDDGPTWWVGFTRDNVPDVRIAEGVVVIYRPADAG